MTTTVDSIDALRHRLGPVRRSGSVGFVPTMGALHKGHERLMERAREECDVVVVSIFVNPLQFDRPEDLAKYPRTVESDLDVCVRNGVDVVFVPDRAELYPTEPACTVNVGRLADHLCGPYRPGHFRGVATIVLKLFQIVEADRVYFGEKDAQQLAIIRRMVKDFNLTSAIVGVPTVREADGLALSSRNRHLNRSERDLAPALYRALLEAERLIISGVTDPVAIVRAAAGTIPVTQALRLEYLEIVDPETLQPVTRVTSAALVAGALWIGTTRLIDNAICSPTTHRA